MPPKDTGPQRKRSDIALLLISFWRFDHQHSDYVALPVVAVRKVGGVRRHYRELLFRWRYSPGHYISVLFHASVVIVAALAAMQHAPQHWGPVSVSADQWYVLNQAVF